MIVLFSYTKLFKLILWIQKNSCGRARLVVNAITIVNIIIMKFTVLGLVRNTEKRH